MKFHELKTGDIFRLVSSYPHPEGTTYMRISCGDYNVVIYKGWFRGSCDAMPLDMSVEVVDISHG